MCRITNHTKHRIVALCEHSWWFGHLSKYFLSKFEFLVSRISTVLIDVHISNDCLVFCHLWIAIYFSEKNRLPVEAEMGRRGRYNKARVFWTSQKNHNTTRSADDWGSPVSQICEYEHLRWAQLNVSSHTIKRRLHDAGLHHRVPAKKPLLTDIQNNEVEFRPRVFRLRF